MRGETQGWYSFRCSMIAGTITLRRKLRQMSGYDYLPFSLYARVHVTRGRTINTFRGFVEHETSISIRHRQQSGRIFPGKKPNSNHSRGRKKPTSWTCNFSVNKNSETWRNCPSFFFSSPFFFFFSLFSLSANLLSSVLHHN